MIYERNSREMSINWKPTDEELGEQAMEEVVGEIGSTIDNQTAKEVRNRYQSLHVDKHGQDSPYYDPQE